MIKAASEALPSYHQTHDQLPASQTPSIQPQASSLASGQAPLQTPSPTLLPLAQAIDAQTIAAYPNQSRSQVHPYFQPTTSLGSQAVQLLPYGVLEAIPSLPPAPPPPPPLVQLSSNPSSLPTSSSLSVLPQPPPNAVDQNLTPRSEVLLENEKRDAHSFKGAC